MHTRHALSRDRIAIRLGNGAALSWAWVYVILFLYRSAFSVLGELVVSRMTEISDAVTYRTSDIAETVKSFQEFGLGLFGLRMQFVATEITKLIAAALNMLFAGNVILVNIGFQAIGWVGLVHLLSRLPPSYRVRMLPLIVLPSFSVWSSIVSKETILVLLVSVVCAYAVDLYRRRGRLTWWRVAALMLLFMYKPHYMIAIVFLFATTIAARSIRQRGTIVLLATLASLACLYAFRYEIDSFSSTTAANLAAEPGRSQREPFLVHQWDVFWKAPEGMFRAFMGPLASEASSGLLQAASFIESTCLLFLLGYYVLRELPRLPFYNVLLSFFTILWTLFPNYPLGVTNPGTAVRYRTGFALLIFTTIVFLMSRRTFLDWASPGRTRGAPPDAVGVAARASPT